MPPKPVTFGAYLYEQYAKIFDRPWAVMPSGLVIAAVGVFLFAFDRPWTASDGIRNWDDWLLRSVGVFEQPDLLPPWLYSGSVLNLGLLFGAFAAALLSREFAVRRAPGSEIVKGSFGGFLMGWGAVLAFGCNIGGFFSATSALSFSGLGMMAGLTGGSFLGARYLRWENARLIGAGKLPFQSACEGPSQRALPDSFTLQAGEESSTSLGVGWQPIAGAAVFVALLAAGYLYTQLGYAPQAGVWFFGLALGVLFQRSRFCLVRAFREPFLSGESEHARAAALALVLSVIGFSILKSTDLKDTMEWVFPSWWLGSVVGGALFGIGMVIAGGCGAGSIWRAGEGHVKLWAALLFFAIGGSMARLILVETDAIRKLGSAVFLPNVIGWGTAVWAVSSVMILWYLLSGWNEQRKEANARLQ
jgi:uncharacterized membrane protein YedE/YeeE